MNTQTQTQQTREQEAFDYYFKHTNLVDSMKTYKQFNELQIIEIMKNYSSMDRMIESYLKSCFLRFSHDIDIVNDMIRIFKKLVFDRSLNNNDLKNTPIKDFRVYVALLLDFHTLATGGIALYTRLFDFIYFEKL